MFRIKAYPSLLVLSITTLGTGALLFFRSTSSWLTLIVGAVLWFVGCAMMIALCMIATFRGEEKKSENQVPMRGPCAAVPSHFHIRAERSGQVVSYWLVPVIAALTLIAFIFGAAALLLKS
jgi:hypothetical protein